MVIDKSGGLKEEEEVQGPEPFYSHVGIQPLELLGKNHI